MLRYTHIGGLMMNELKVGSCFSGVGFWEMALKELQIPHTNEFCVEFDKFPYASYKAIHGEVKNYGDVTKIQGNEVEDIDLFFYSPPCQAFSVAGKGLGVEEHRGVLFFDSLRIIQHKQPRVAIMENVKGLTNKPHAETLRSMLACLTMAGYTNCMKVLNTKDYGIPQNRERVFIVSIRNDIDHGFDFPATFDNGVRLKHMLESEVDEKYYISNEKCEKLLSQLKSEMMPGGIKVSRKGEMFEGNTEICSTIMARDYKGLDNTIKTAVCVENGCSPTIPTCQGGNQEPKVYAQYRIRKLTPKECWRLQGATDYDFEKAASVNSNSQLYKQAGNGLSVNVVVAILKQLQAKSYI